MANSKDDQGHKDMHNVYFIKNRSNVKIKRFSTDKKISAQGIFMWNMKTLALTVKNLLARLRFLNNRPNSKVKVTGSKNISTHGEVLPQKIFLQNIKALSLTVEKLLARFQFKKNKSNSNVTGTHRKVLSQRLLMWNIKTIEKLIARFKIHT